jgi:hypothetical protein
MDISILGYKVNLEILILIGVIYLILVGHTLCGCCNFYKNMEGFVGANTNNGNSSLYNISNNQQINTSSWSAPNLNVVPGQPLSAGVQNILNRKKQPIPLPEGEMLLFANTEFKPECCPNTYSNSSGCACMTTDQYNYLMLRGSNNVPYSEY